MTAKNSKKDLFAEVKRVLESSPVLEKNWVDRAKYALKAGLDKCTKTDLLGLLKEAAELSNTPAPVENSPKPSLKKSGKNPKAEKNAEPEKTADVEEKSENVEPAEEKPQKKGGKSLKAPKSKVEEAPKLSQKSLTLAKVFPKTIEVKDLGTLEARNDEFRTMTEVVNALNEGRELYFATYWTARQIKEFDYAGVCQVPCPKSFDNDLDILMAVVTCTNIERVWCMSVYTEAMYNFNGDELEPVADKDADGNKYLIRVSNGMEFEIYEKISE